MNNGDGIFLNWFLFFSPDIGAEVIEKPAEVKKKPAER